MECDYCGKPINISRNQKKYKHHFCNRECYLNYRKRGGKLKQPAYTFSTGKMPEELFDKCRYIGGGVNTFYCTDT
jgi:hypothetical protein